MRGEKIAEAFWNTPKDVRLDLKNDQVQYLYGSDTIVNQSSQEDRFCQKTAKELFSKLLKDPDKEFMEAQGNLQKAFFSAMSVLNDKLEELLANDPNDPLLVIGSLANAKEVLFWMDHFLYSENWFDPTLNEQDVLEYGYQWDLMIPMTRPYAKAAFLLPFPIFHLREDDSESLEEAGEFDEFPTDLWGIEYALLPEVLAFLVDLKERCWKLEEQMYAAFYKQLIKEPAIKQ